MTLIDLVGGVSAATAGSALALRAYMLKPKFGDWCSAPTRVWASLMALSVSCMIAALSIFGGRAPATAREALVLIVLAVTALVLLDNLNRQGALARSAGDKEGGGHDDA
ncbi:hypothetical protein [Caulobacter sp.]|uniref:hypothetical protein n=1 Tax=Caulobacter sp. TaxID=78 RepID=UPI003BB092FC